jgi:NADH dehydrogenase
MVIQKKKIVVVGGGFAGLNFCTSVDPTYFDVYLLDKVNHHQFQPLFYQVAAAQIEPASISFPFRNIFRSHKHVHFRLEEVRRVDTTAKQVFTDRNTYDFDYLVIAAGCKTHFFGNEAIARRAFTLKSTTDAMELRNHLLGVFERLLVENSDSDADHTIVIVGAGPTGVELAGAFSEIRTDILPKEYPGLDPNRFSIVLVEGSPNTLNAMSDTARKASRMFLERMGVKLITHAFVTQYDGQHVSLNDGTRIPTTTLVWAAGVTANKIEGLPSFTDVPAGRIKVDRYNKVDGLEDVYVIGDIAYMSTPKYPKGHPQLANVAINQAKNLAANLKKRSKGSAMKPYEYLDLGSMATIGRNKAVVDLPFMHFSGLIAWMVWMFLHLMLILTVKNKVIIFIHWVWSYFARDSSLRLILQSKGLEGRATDNRHTEEIEKTDA